VPSTCRPTVSLNVIIVSDSTIKLQDFCIFMCLPCVLTLCGLLYVSVLIDKACGLVDQSMKTHLCTPYFIESNSEAIQGGYTDYILVQTLSSSYNAV